ncbi:MAG TPA: hypothetical protein DET40_17850 [Lentisphaeria bacterium]|nr:MAG: hypothetical protein A2X45_02165 [Lentisphaerae bacterium GWF2_50_93]HCE45406.1 hypothetical protein [Lentisphaeria bacterium]
MKTNLLSSLIAVVFLTGCATSFDKISAEKRLNTINLDKGQIADAQLKKPFKLAIFADLETVDGATDFYESWDWSQIERKMISSYADDLKKEGYVSEYFFIPDQELSIQDINSIMQEAGSRGADALVAIRGIIKVNRYMNPAALLDPTIIGALWLPGSNRDVMVLSHLDMWNMKSREALISVKSDCIKKDVAPTLLISTADTVNEAKTDGLRSLLMQFKKKIHALKMD